jgi:hypothetical protein
MILDLLPRTVLKGKIKARQRRLYGINSDSNSSLITLDDYLLAGNKAAVEYFEKNTNPLRKLWEYWRLDPCCGSHSTYTYAAFLYLTNEHERTELQDDIRWVGGIYVNLENTKARGHHAWLEKRVNNEWQPFDTIPHMRDMPAFYLPWYTFQLTKGSAKVTSEQFCGLLAISIYGFCNS